MSFFFIEVCLILSNMESEVDIQKFLDVFGQRIKALRKQQGFTQLDLAERTQMDVRQIQRIEAGDINTSIGNAYLIAEGLGISVPELFQFEQKTD